jgi:UDP-glucuronate 4-epimerase
MKIFVTGSAGFIGSALTRRLLQRGDIVIGLDNHNDYYEPKLKEDRVKLFINHPNYKHIRIDLEDSTGIHRVFRDNTPDIVVNLAAQAGVRNSITNPTPYVTSNILGFLNVLEGSRHFKVKHLIYASSSSVYGANTNLPFSENHTTDHPINLYAASKKANELMAHSYSHLYKLPTTGLRFFTVYGPWGRPDMALFYFTKAILSGEKIQVFNHGNHLRDFTYIDDVIEALVRVVDRQPVSNNSWSGDKPDLSSSSAPWRIYNIGNNNPIKLMDYILALERFLGKKAIKEFLPLQDGDIPVNRANVDKLFNQFDFKPAIQIDEGIQLFVDWYKNYYSVC